MRTESKLLRVSWNPNDMNGEHLSPKTRELLDRPMEERIAHIQKDSWIPYSQANKILQQLEDLLKHPKCDRMPNLAVTAQTNNERVARNARVVANAADPFDTPKQVVI